jgi:hypothetical protein
MGCQLSREEALIMNDFKSERLAFPLSKLEHVRKSEKPPRHRSGEQFLKGPIPLRWLCLAAKQPGKALHVGIALWLLAGMKRNRTVTLTNVLLGRFGVDRSAKSRGLRSLEVVGLIAIHRRPNRNPDVTILDPNIEDAGALSPPRNRKDTTVP